MASLSLLVSSGSLVPCCCQCCCSQWYHHLGHRDGRCLHHIQVCLGHTEGDEAWQVESWSQAPLPYPGFLGFGAPMLWPRIVGTSTAGRTGSQAPLLLLLGSLWPQVSLWSGCWSHMCYLPCWYQALWGSVPMARGPGSQAPPLLFPGSVSSMCSSPPTFRCTDVWNSPASRCVGQRNIC